MFIEENRVDNASNKRGHDGNQAYESENKELEVDSGDVGAKANGETVKGLDSLATTVIVSETVGDEIVYMITEDELVGTSFLIFICHILCFCLSFLLFLEAIGARDEMT
jgi:hypothetical protein